MLDRLVLAARAVTPGSGTEGPGKMGDLRANRVCLCAVTEGRCAPRVRVGLSLQDKNVFDIACNCVMFTLLISEGSYISKQAFDCHVGGGGAFLWDNMGLNVRFISLLLLESLISLWNKIWEATNCTVYAFAQMWDKGLFKLDVFFSTF